MNEKQLFAKYHINKSHCVWDNKIDNWSSVEIYRIMHDGELPPPDDTSTLWVCEFLDFMEKDPVFLAKIMKRDSIN
jgi:hypothetical protein